MRPPLVLLFDGTCGFCTRCVRWLREHDPAGLVVATVNQAPGVTDVYGLTRADVDRSLWVIDVDGRKASGAAAVNAVFAARGGVGALAARLYPVRPVGWLEDRIYAFVANHRQVWSHWWGDVPECDGGGCG